MNPSSSSQKRLRYFSVWMLRSWASSIISTWLHPALALSLRTVSTWRHFASKLLLGVCFDTSEMIASHMAAAVSLVLSSVRGKMMRIFAPDSWMRSMRSLRSVLLPLPDSPITAIIPAFFAVRYIYSDVYLTLSVR